MDFKVFQKKKGYLNHLNKCNEIKPVNPKGNLSWIFIGRTDAETETPKFWPPVVKNWLLGKDPDAGKDWSQKEKETTEDEMVRWHHRLYGHESEQAPGAGDGQGSLVCCSSWGCKELDMTELNWNKSLFILLWFFKQMRKINRHLLLYSFFFIH